MARLAARPRRVVLVHYTTPAILGGVEQVMAAHAAALREAGARVTIVAGRGRAVPKGVALARIPLADSRHPAVQRDFDALARGEVPATHERLVASLERALAPHVAKADRVVVHNVLTMHKDLALTEAIARLARTHPGRVVAWTHDLAWCDPQYRSQRHPGRPWDLIATALPGVRYVVVSDERRRQLASLTGLAASDITVVPNGIDLDATLGLSAAGARIADRFELRDADPLLLLPARITRRKRIEAAIEAVAALRASGANAALVVTGSPGAHNRRNREYLAELVALARTIPGVHLLYAEGVRPRYRVVADLYALADVLVLPSESEGFGIPVLEAGARRLPIVCSDIPAFRATARDAATFVPADAGGAVIASAVRRALDTPAARLARRAKEHAWARVVREAVLPVILGP